MKLSHAFPQVAVGALFALGFSLAGALNATEEVTKTAPAPAEAAAATVAATPPAPAAENEAVSADAVTATIKQRAQARWDALARRDFAAAYAFETPGYRAVTGTEAFAAQFGAMATWHGAEVLEARVDADGAAAQVALALSYRATPPSGEPYEGRRRIEETWIKVDDQWWFARQ